MTSSQHGCQPLDEGKEAKKARELQTKTIILIPARFVASPPFFPFAHPPSILMNFYFTSQQVTSGLMPVYTKVLIQVSSEMKTHKHGALNEKNVCELECLTRSAFCCWL